MTSQLWDLIVCVCVYTHGIHTYMYSKRLGKGEGKQEKKN